ncbi:MAG: carboxypeptidase regulatory-like domain-containing protein [Nitrosomonadales bacterium]|nr:carboxypeptidase regulatory-like domain-containing protein [Nitrosomonadales bacterium]
MKIKPSKKCLGRLFMAVAIPVTGGVSLADAAVIEGFVGASSTQVAPGVTVKLLDGKTGKVIAMDETNFFGKYKFEEVSPGFYNLTVDNITRELMVKGQDDKKRLDIDLSAKGGAMDYSKAGREPEVAGSSGKPARKEGGSGAGPSNPSLQAQIAGVWWGYSGSTERKIGLCADGSYMDYTESSYSGRAQDPGGTWGTASQRGGQGSWAIQGDTNSGVINVRYSNGNTTSLRYRQMGDPGCLDVNGNTLCRQSASCR